MCTQTLFCDLKRLEVRYNRRPPKLLQTESSFMNGSLLLGMFVVSILWVSIVLSLLSLTHYWKIMKYLLSVLNLCDNDNKQINLTDKYVKGRIWWSYFVYNQGHLIAWREKEVEHFIGSGLVVFVLFSFGLVIKSWWLLFAVSFTEEGYECVILYNCVMDIIRDL